MPCQQACIAAYGELASEKDSIADQGKGQQYSWVGSKLEQLGCEQAITGDFREQACSDLQETLQNTWQGMEQASRADQGVGQHS